MSSTRIDPNFSPVKWQSPLKEDNSQGKRPLTLSAQLALRSDKKVKRSLNFSEQAINDEKTELTPVINGCFLAKVYGSYFLRLDGTRDNRYFEVEELFIQIENHFCGEEAFLINSMRNYLKNLLQKESNHGLLISELGVALFYLVCKPKELSSFTLPEGKCDFFLNGRAEALVREVEELTANHKAHALDELSASGRPYYLMRAFAHMIILPNGDYNKGGLAAINTLLSLSKYQITSYFSYEHFMHILHVVKTLYGNPAFNSLFRKTISVHPNLEGIIRLELMLAHDEPLKPPLVHIALLLTILREKFQTDLPNCYALASWHYLTESETYKLYAQLIDWLQTDTLSLSYQDFPIHLLLPERLKPSLLQLDAKLHQGASNLQTLLFLKSRFSPSISDTSLTLEGETVGAQIRSITHNSSPETQANARALWEGFFSSPISAMFEAVVDHLRLNGPIKNSKGTTANYAEEKRALFKAYRKLLSDPHLKDLDPLWDMLSKKLDQYLCLHSMCKPDFKRINKNNTYLLVKNYVIPPANNKVVENLIQLLQVTPIGFYSYRDGKLNQILTISELQAFFVQSINEVIQERLEEKKVKEDPDLTRIQKKWVTITNHKSTKKAIAKVLSSFINTPNLTEEVVLNANLLLTRHSGGNLSNSLRDIFGIRLDHYDISPRKNSTEFISIFLDFLKNFELSRLKRGNRFLIAAWGRHLWTVESSRWAFLKQLIKSDLDEFVVKGLDDPVAKRWASPCPSAPQLTYDEYYQQVLDGTPPENLSAAQSRINHEMSLISLTSHDIITLDKKIGLNLSKEEELKLLDEIQGNNLPHFYAEKIRLWLLKNKFFIIDSYKLEVVICLIKSLPIPIYFGDSNWGDEEESPERNNLFIQYHWGKGNYQLSNRFDNKEKDYLDWKISIFY